MSRRRNWQTSTTGNPNSEPQIQFVHGVSVTKHRNPLTMLVGHLFGCHAAFEKDRFLKNEPHSVAGFLSLYTLRRDQAETASEESKIVKGSLFTPLTSIGQFCYALFVWCDVIFRLPREKNTRHQLGKGMKEITLENTPWSTLHQSGWNLKRRQILYNQYSVFPDLHFSQVKLMPTCFRDVLDPFGSMGYASSLCGLASTSKPNNKQIRQFKKCEQNVDKLTLITLTKTSTTRHQIPRSVNSCRTSLGLPVFLR